MTTMDQFLAKSASLHGHLCPRQVLGVRMGMLVGTLLELQFPQEDKRLLTISETDGCFVDGISAATNCTAGHRTLRIEDYGKIAATFVDTKMNIAFRVTPHPRARTKAIEYAPSGSTKWDSYLIGYQRMPDEVLLCVQPVELNFSLKELISKPGVRTVCKRCGEEIINEREVMNSGSAYCKSCMFGGYYCVIESEVEIESNKLRVLEEP